MHHIPFLRFVISTSLLLGAAPSTSGSVSSTTASYNGSALVLSGSVTLDHGLGKMHAEEAQLEKQEEITKDFPFRLIHLTKHVLLHLKNHAEMVCEEASLDFTALKGQLRAKEGEKVSYTDHFKKKASKDNSLRMLSNTMDLSFLKNDKQSDKTEYTVDTAMAQGAVDIFYGEDFCLKADKAIYRRQLLSQDKTASHEFQGVISAYPAPSSKCLLVHDNDTIEADLVDIDLIHSKLSLSAPVGKLATSMLATTPGNSIDFSGGHLVWDLATHTLTLQDQAQIIDPLIGSLRAEEKIVLTQNGTKKTLENVTAYGPTTLSYQTEVGAFYTLSSYGTLVLDRAHEQALCESPLKEGVVTPETQVHYEDNHLSFYADKALFEYAEEEGKLIPTAFTLRGNVRLFSKDIHNKASYGTGDRLQYSPETHTLILSAAPGKKVLFWDEVNKMSLSAKEVHILQDPHTKERTVQGIGNLRLTFDPSEHALFQQLFPEVSLDR